MEQPAPVSQIGHAYASPAYLRSLSHAGRSLDVPAWGAPVVLRTIPGVEQMDAMGAYPVCVIAPGADIAAGLQTLRDAGLVSVVLVADPVCGVDAETLQRHFPFCVPFKTHYLITGKAGLSALSKHHRDRVRRGEKRATACQVSLRDPVWLAHWCQLYAGLVQHRGITGVQAFSDEAFDALAALPEESLLAFAAVAPDGDVLAMQLWVRHGDSAYSHLTATSEAGYRASATFVVYAAAIAYLQDCATLDLGGGAGFADDPENSLAQFKQGFANDTAISMLCGAVLDQAAYDRLAGQQDGSFFPVYRTPR
jgi:hypothetical protein